MGGSPKLGNPGPLAPPPWPLASGFGVGASWRMEPTLVSGSIELQPAPLMQPLCQAWKRAPAHYLETFLLEIPHRPAFSLSILSPILSSHTTSPIYPANSPPPIQSSSRNRCPSLPQTVKHQPGAKTTPEPTPQTPEHTRHHLRRNNILVHLTAFSAEHK